MKKDPLLLAVVFVVGILIGGYCQHRDDLAGLVQANRRITELTQTITIKDQRLEILDSEASYQRTLVEGCLARERFQNDRDAARAARRDSVSGIPSRFFEP